ncbi:MAG: glycosyltransferase [Anaerolineae bacterium]|nr:glycosyltransferase [Anaerolineae bacterium]MCB0210505.1 glycosyltransferase [Anaerolineae bacterium]
MAREPDDRPVAVHFVPTYYELTENWIQTQLQNLRRYRPLVLTMQTDNLNGDFISDHYALRERSWWEYTANRLWYWAAGYHFSFARLLRRQHAQLLHVHFGHHSWQIGLPLARISGLPLVTTFYGYDLSRLPQSDVAWRQRYQDLFRLGACFLVEGPYMAEQLHELGCSTKKTVVQHLGVDLTRFTYRPRELHPGEPLRLLAAGRFTEKKGLVYAVEAIARLAKQGYAVNLTLIGDAGASAENQAAKRCILQAIHANHLQDQVILRGMQPYSELRQAYYEHHVFLAPSVQAADGDNEGGAPVTVIEAAATGMPVVGTNHCDIPEVVQHGVTGLLAPERDSTALADHLAWFYHNSNQLRQMGVMARQHIETEYNAARQGERLAEIYDKVLYSHGSGSKNIG